MPCTASAKQDKLAKVRPLIAVLIPKFLNLYNPSQNLSPDESMLKIKGRLSFVQYMPRKPIKRGMKAFSLNELHMRVETVYRSQRHKNCTMQTYV